MEHKTNKSFENILSTYYNRNIKYLQSNNIEHEMNGVVLSRTNNELFYFYGKMVDETIDYCKRLGYKPDKIVFINSYDITIKDTPHTNIKMNADSKIRLIKEDNQIIAMVCIGEYVCVSESQS